MGGRGAFGASGAGERTAFILFTDIHRSTKLWERFPPEFEEALEQHNSAVEATVLSHSGEIMKNLGDGYIAIFDTADECVRSAIEVQRQMRSIRKLPDGSELMVRVVAHSGPLRRLAAGRGYFGEPLNRCSRICQVCHPGQLLVSHAVVALMRRLAGPTRVSDLGTHHLRDLAEPEHLYQVDHPDFSLHSFPPLATLAYRPNNLCVQPNAFIGREREQAELREMLAARKHRLVTIVAPGGYGKSRLAAQVGANLLDEYANGVFEVLLASVAELAQIVTATAGALGLKFYGHAEPEDQLLDYLREKDLLLLMDNFEHLLEGRSLLRRLLQHAPKVGLLVTSREALRLQGEKAYWLDALPVQQSSGAPAELPDSVALFAERASLVSQSFQLTPINIDLVQQVCERLDGVPLAIELAAAWSDVYPLPQILKSVEHQLDVVARMSDLPERHHSVRACLEHSYRLLGSEQAQALRALAVFAGSFSLEAASRVLAVPETPLLLSELHSKSWIYSCPRGEEARFCLRQAQREYVGELLARDERLQEHYERFTEYFASFLELRCAELAGPRQLDAVTAIGIDLDNLHLALRLALEWENLGAISRFAEHLRCYFEYVGGFPQGASYYGQILAVLDELPPGGEVTRARMFSHLGLGVFQWRLGKTTEAQAEFAVAREFAEKLGNETALAHSISAIANAHIRSGDYAAAETLHRQAIELWRRHGEPSGLSHSYNGLGASLFFQGKLEEAEECYRTSLHIARESGDFRSTARALNNLGLRVVRRGDLDEAGRLFEEAVEISRRLGAADVLSLAINNLGYIALNESDFALAKKWFAESLDFSREIGHLYEVAGALNNLGEVCTKEGAYDEARRHLLQSLALAEKQAEPIVRVEAVIRAGLLLSLTGDKAAAAALLHQTLAAADAMGVSVAPRSREEASAVVGMLNSSLQAVADTGPPSLAGVVSAARAVLQT